MAIIQSYRGNAKKVNLRVKRTMPVDDEPKKKTKKKDDEVVRKVKLSGGKATKGRTVRVRRYEEE